MNRRDLGLALATLLTFGSLGAMLLPTQLPAGSISLLWRLATAGIGLGIVMSLADTLLAPSPGKVLMSLGWLLGIVWALLFFSAPPYTGEAALTLLVGGAFVRALEPTGVVPFA